MNPLREAQKLGQSIWLDYMRRDLITSGRLQRLINDDGVSGITSNPTIFEKAIAESNLYDSDIETILRQSKRFARFTSAPEDTTGLSASK
jgi:transaldolase